MELRKIRLAYWTIRLGLVTDEHRALKSKLEEIDRLQSKKSLPLQESRKSVATLEQLRGRFGWLSEDLVESKRKLDELTV